MPLDNLDVYQQVYLQTFAANLAGTVVGTEAIVQAALTKAIGLLMSGTLQAYGWEVTWGPRVWKKDPNEILSGLDNAWFASFCPNVKYSDTLTMDTCVIAIAGTAVFSKEDWPVENFGVDEVVDFASWSKDWKVDSIPEPTGSADPPSNNPYLAFGTSMGVYQLATNTAPADAPGAGKTIIEYLQTLPGNCRVIFSGHSLGGALSPTLPMCIESADLLKNINDPLNNILTLPAAGATPGEKLLSETYAKLFQANELNGYKTFNADFFNTLDIVPQAWCTDPTQSPDRNVKNILDIYGTLPQPLHGIVDNLIQKESKTADASGVTYYPIRGNAFEGDKPSSPPSELVGFTKEVIKQHTKAYYDQLKVGQITARLYSEVVGFEGVEKQNLHVAARRYPVIRWVSKDGLLGDDGENVYPYDVILDVE